MGPEGKDSVLLAEYVRIALKRHISHKHSSGQNILPAYLLAPNVEETLRGAIRQTSAGSYLALDPAAGKALLENIKRTVGDLGNAVQPVLLTSMDIRRYLRKMIEQDLYEPPVLSYQELTQEIAAAGEGGLVNADGLELRVLSGLHRRASAPIGALVTIGADPDCDIVLADDGIAARAARSTTTRRAGP